jgi:hypothetical protein
MKQPFFTTVLGYLLVTLAGTVYTAPVSANAASDCRQEAMDYDIPAEQRDDYINGCLASRGEMIADDATGMDYAPPVEPDGQQDSLTGNADAGMDYVPQLELDVQQDSMTGDADAAQ